MLSAGASEPTRWAFAVAPLDDELLSSYLSRAALRHGLSPYRFCAYHFPGVAVWNRDIDRSASALFLQRLSDACGVDLDNLAPLLLKPPMGVQASAGRWPWVNAVGIYHRKRRRFGLMFCPRCLRESAHFRRMWRYSAVTVCEQHGCDLQDACPACGAPVVPHRQGVEMQRCSACSADLRASGPRAGAAHCGLRSLQQFLVQMGSGGSVALAGEQVDGRDVLWGSRILIQVMAAAQLRHGRLADPELLQSSVSDGLEQSRLAGRRRLLAVLGQVTAAWPSSFRTMTQRLRVAQPAFPRPDRLPAWLASEVLLLPAGHRWRYSSANGMGSVSARLQAIVRSNDIDWRMRRAQLLLHSIRRPKP